MHGAVRLALEMPSLTQCVRRTWPVPRVIRTQRSNRALCFPRQAATPVNTVSDHGDSLLKPGASINDRRLGYDSSHGFVRFCNNIGETMIRTAMQTPLCFLNLDGFKP
jgi:hypothetical protein